MKKFRLLLAADQWVVRRGLLAIFQPAEDFDVAGEAEDVERLIAQVTSLLPDMVLADRSLPGAQSIGAAQEVKSVSPSTAVVILSDLNTELSVLEAIRAGAAGYLSHRSPPEDILRAARAVVRGDAYLAPPVARVLFSRLAALDPPLVLAEQTTSPAGLTDREKRVFELLARNCRNREIAERLYISEATVKTHVSNILKKLRVADRSEVVLYAAQRGLLAQAQLAVGQQ